MSYFMFDVESDGPIPNKYSMILLGVVKCDETLNKTFLGKLKPISDLWDPDSLKISGYTREETLNFDDPKEVMIQLDDWINKTTINRPIFISDNNGYDWQFVNYYFHYFLGKNPLGYSSVNLGSLYKGLVKDTKQNFKHLRKTKHDHNPVNDAKGNAEALIYMNKYMGLNIKL